MKTRKSRLLVVDASVIHSAGETDHPVSSACREVLKAILNICHRVAFTDAIRQEWQIHLSRYSRKWLRSMAAHKKYPIKVSPEEVKISLAGLSGKEKDIIEKDLCLIKAALSADRIIITLDITVQNALKKIPPGIKIHDSIKWINPVIDGIKSIENL